MRIRGGLLLVAGGGALIHVVGSWLGSTSVAAQGGLLALAALAGYVVVGRRASTPAVVWPLVAGLAVLAVLAGADDLWPHESSYGQSFASRSAEETWAVLRESADRWASRQRWISLGMLAASGCFAVALLALPRRSRPWLAVATAAMALPLLGFVLADAWDVATGGWYGGGGWFSRAVDVAGAAWLPTVAALTALGAAVIAGQRAGGIAAVGAAALTVPALTAARDAVRLVPTQWLDEAEGAGHLFLSDSVAIDRSTTDPAAAAVAALTLAGVGLIVIGCMRSGPAVPGTPETAGDGAA